MRLIDADNLSELCDIMADKCESPTIWNQFRTTVECSPTIDPVRHGRWLTGGYVCGETEWICSVCGETEWRTNCNRMKYCMFCGAKMNEEVDDDKG